MTFSYTQISQYLRCRELSLSVSGRLEGEGVSGAAMLRRCFEKALAAYFEREDAGAVLFKEWGVYRDAQLEYSQGDDWERLLRQGIGLLEQFARDNRIRIRQPQRNMQKKLIRPLANGDEFVLRRCNRPSGWCEAFARMENDRCSISRAARGADIT